MIKNAWNYRDCIHVAFSKCMYDLDYQWYFGGRGMELPTIENDNYEKHELVSIDEYGMLRGYISYDINAAANSCSNFGFISFDKGNFLFIKDMLQVIYDIFYKYNFDRLDFFCFEQNPAIRGYRSFIKRFGGREVGYFRNSNRLMDGKLYNSVMFEVCKCDLDKVKLSRVIL